MHDLTGFQRDILYVIAGLDEPHGLAVKAELDKRTNLYSLTQRGSREIEARREWEDEYIESAEEVATST
ncbi:hypothetical protein [Halorussus marinus]|uniref:hypothetical protein n=1 Tax=Halorussus marinus TaxID=2505976 RepID=UPI00106E2A82|nr:hypothetical protein [Halorussus marinus]